MPISSLTGTARLGRSAARALAAGCGAPRRGRSSMAPNGRFKCASVGPPALARNLVRKILTRQGSRRARRLDRLPSHLTVRWNRGPIRLSQAERRRSNALTMSSTDLLLDVTTAAQLFHASDGTGFADLIIDGHRETWPLRSKRFRTWLRQQYYERTWDAPSPAALNAALNVLEAQAQFDGPQRKVSLRVAEHDGLIYLDLADEFWRCIEIGANGWRIAEDPPVRFRRSAGMQPLPLPLRGGSIDSLAPFLNLASEDDFVLVVAWLLGALQAGGPYPVLAIAGEQGSAKTVLSKLLRALIDPSVAPVRALPRDERELFIAASNGHVLAFDNLSSLPPWLSDTLCRLTSGGAFSTRRLFTDQDEMLFAAARPVILNGIEDFITRPDLADRAIMLMLAPIAERQRRPEHALWREFAARNASASEPVRADEGRTRSGRFWRSGPCLESRISHGLRPRCAPPSLIRVRWSLFSTGRNSITAGSPSGSRSWTRRFSCVSRC